MSDKAALMVTAPLECVERMHAGEVIFVGLIFYTPEGDRLSVSLNTLFPPEELAAILSKFGVLTGLSQ